VLWIRLGFHSLDVCWKKGKVKVYRNTFAGGENFVTLASCNTLRFGWVWGRPAASCLASPPPRRPCFLSPRVMGTAMNSDSARFNLRHHHIWSVAVY
jgi:hypothetical protein